MNTDFYRSPQDLLRALQAVTAILNKEVIVDPPITGKAMQNLVGIQQCLLWATGTQENHYLEALINNTHNALDRKYRITDPPYTLTE